MQILFYAKYSSRDKSYKMCMICCSLIIFENNPAANYFTYNVKWLIYH